MGNKIKEKAIAFLEKVEKEGYNGVSVSAHMPLKYQDGHDSYEIVMQPLRSIDDIGNGAGSSISVIIT